MNLFKILTPALLVFELAACSTLTISTDYDPNIKKVPLNDYNWLPEPILPKANRHLDNALLDTQIRMSVEETLAKKGFEINTTKPSFLIGYHVTIDKKTDINVVNSYYNTDYAWKANAWRGTTDLGTYTFEQGTLILDVVDPAKNELIWRATAAAEIDPYAKTDQRLARIKHAIEKMLKDFPPQ